MLIFIFKNNSVIMKKFSFCPKSSFQKNLRLAQAFSYAFIQCIAVSCLSDFILMFDFLFSSEVLMVWYINLPYITLTLFPCLWQTIIPLALREAFWIFTFKSFTDHTQTNYWWKNVYVLLTVKRRLRCAQLQ